MQVCVCVCEIECVVCVLNKTCAALYLHRLCVCLFVRTKCMYSLCWYEYDAITMHDTITKHWICLTQATVASTLSSVCAKPATILSLGSMSTHCNSRKCVRVVYGMTLSLWSRSDCTWSPLGRESGNQTSSLVCSETVPSMERMMHYYDAFCWQNATLTAYSKQDVSILYRTTI